MGQFKLRATANESEKRSPPSGRNSDIGNLFDRWQSYLLEIRACVGFFFTSFGIGTPREGNRGSSGKNCAGHRLTLAIFQGKYRARNIFGCIDMAKEKQKADSNNKEGFHVQFNLVGLVVFTVSLVAATGVLSYALARPLNKSNAHAPSGA